MAVKDDLFTNTPESQRYLVSGGPDSMLGSARQLPHVWAELLGTAESIRTGRPQSMHRIRAVLERPPAQDRPMLRGDRRGDRPRDRPGDRVPATAWSPQVILSTVRHPAASGRRALAEPGRAPQHKAHFRVVRGARQVTSAENSAAGARTRKTWHLPLSFLYLRGWLIDIPSSSTGRSDGARWRFSQKRVFR